VQTVVLYHRTTSHKHITRYIFDISRLTAVSSPQVGALRLPCLHARTLHFVASATLAAKAGVGQTHRLMLLVRSGTYATLTCFALSIKCNIREKNAAPRAYIYGKRIVWPKNTKGLAGGGRRGGASEARPSTLTLPDSGAAALRSRRRCVYTR
jgi:hypothetical protein